MPLASCLLPIASMPIASMPIPCSLFPMLQAIVLCYNYYKTNLTIPLLCSA
ncbi:MAG: hypothetical protein F6K55_04410 [Moorea sp. SIO4A3]|nr:hypothetical protein [Moorena sp. SIO4A3]